MPTEGNLFFGLIGIAILGAALILAIMFAKKGSRNLDVNKYRLRWLSIEKQLTPDDAGSHQLAVINADKLLDQALKESGVKGETMGARMKNAQNTWSNANVVWGSHKLRNRIAHESEVQVSYNDARRALAGFKQALKDLGAI